MANPQIYPAQAVMDGGGLRPSPFQFYMTGEENLRIRTLSQTVGDTIVISGRFWRASDQTITPFRFEVLTNGPAALDDHVFSLSAGALLNLSVFSETVPSSSLKTWIVVQVIRGVTGAIVPLGTLLQGYVTSGVDLAWPGSPLQQIEDDPGQRGTIATWAPLIGNPDTTVTVGTNEVWELVAANAILTTSAVAANRQLAARWISTTGGVIYSSDAPVNIPAGTPARVSVGDGGSHMGASSAFLQITLPWPRRARMIAGEGLRFVIGNAQAGDTIVAQGWVFRSWFRL